MTLEQLKIELEAAEKDIHAQKHRSEADRQSHIKSLKREIAKLEKANNTTQTNPPKTGKKKNNKGDK